MGVEGPVSPKSLSALLRRRLARLAAAAAAVGSAAVGSAAAELAADAEGIAVPDMRNEVAPPNGTS